MLILAARLLTLTTGLTIAGALPAPAWAQPHKPEMAKTTSRADPEEPGPDSDGPGKKVKTEVEKAQAGKARPAENNARAETRPRPPGAPVSSTPAHDQ
ncbi:hypothetical protein [Emcibacter sp. SYSU 3D8]|uniref:hypothetical protein n=1 Tax=Emcibacter sp. SYSU 3D8 TaxID=3133969 RepID=UPI0031FEEDA2